MHVLMFVAGAAPAILVGAAPAVAAPTPTAALPSPPGVAVPSTPAAPAAPAPAEPAAAPPAPAAAPAEPTPAPPRPAVERSAPQPPRNALHLEAGGPFFTGGLQYERRVAAAWLVRGGYGLVPLDLRDTEAPVHVLTVGGGWAPPVGRRGLEATLGATLLSDGSEALAQPALFLGFRDQRAAALVWRLGFTLRLVPWPTASLGWAF